MKLFSRTAFMICIVIAAASFKDRSQGGVIHYKYDGRFTAVVDGQKFDTRTDNKHTAQVVSRIEDNMIAEPKRNRVVTELSFFGNNFFDDNGNQWEERLNIAYDFNEGTTGLVTGENVTFQFRNHHFISKGDTKFKVTKLQWNKDKTAFTMSADFDCKMIEWNTPGQSKPMVRISGKIENIEVAVPAEVLQSAAQLASAE